MKLKTILSKVTAIVAVTFVFGACDDDFNSVGSEVLGDVNFQENQYASIPVAYSKRFEKVQSSSLPSYLLGFYDDPFYKESSYNVVSQIQPSSFNPDFGLDPVLKSVVISVPYYNTVLSSEVIDNELISTYKLDSIYGNAPIKLSIYKSNYFLRDLDTTANQTEAQVYYSDFITENIESSLEGRILYKLDEFVPSDKEIVSYGPDNELDADTDPQVIKVSPRIRLEYRADGDYLKGAGIDPADNGSDGSFIKVDDQGIIEYFQEQIIDKAGSVELSNANNFNNYFRGIYFKAEKSVNGTGNLIFFDMSRARLTLSYAFNKIDIQDEDDDGDRTDIIPDEGEFEFTFTNNVVNSFDSNFSNIDVVGSTGATITLKKELENQLALKEAENLYLKGGEGSYAVIELFNKCVKTDVDGNFVVDANGSPVDCVGAGDKTELDFLKEQNWLINNASIKFYINQDRLGVGGITEPERVYVFNLKTGRVLVDYSRDVTANNTENAIGSAVNHLGRITRGSDKKGVFYNIALTRHLVDVLNGTTENIKLGLSVSQNVNIVSTASGFIPENTGNNDGDDNDSDDNEEIIPFSSIISHEGTVLYGNGDNVPDDKRLKLDIFYTELKTN